MSRPDMEALQLERLKALVDYCDRNVEFYHNRLAQAGVTADRIKTLSDVQYIPYTTKTDLRDTYPFGMFSVPKKELVRLHASSGTTGESHGRRLYARRYGQLERSRWHGRSSPPARADGEQRGADLLRLRNVHRRARPALWSGKDRRDGRPTSSGNTVKQLKFMRDFQTDAIVATPSYCLYLCRGPAARVCRGTSLCPPTM